MDPIEELMEVYQDVKEIEANLGKAISIGTFILSKNKEIIQTNVEIQEELEAMELQIQTVEQ
jgi:hypothetical protein